MESTINRRPVARQSVLDQAVDLSRVNWTVVYFVLLLVFVIGTRFWDLGSRALHHDESIHAYYSYQFLNGNPWQYDPAYHGPFLYNMVALGFLLFGVSDATTRIMPAIFGTILVMMCWFMRPYLGRLGAIAAATIVAFSPSIMYYSRALRHDMFALVGTFMLFLGILGFIRSHQAKFLYLAAVGLGIAVCSHELIYINAGIFALFLGLAWIWLRTLGAPGDTDRRLDANPVGSAFSALREQRWALLGAFGVFAAIYVVFYSNLMTDPRGLGGLIQGFQYWLGQHGEARGNQPLYYYALLLGPVYEPLAIFTGIGFLIALVVRTLRGSPAFPADIPAEDYPDRELDERRPAGRGRSANVRGATAVASGTDAFGLALPSAAVMSGFTVAFLAFWGFGALVAYSIAGEKMPWLLMQIAFPFALLAGAGVGRLLGRTDWRTAFHQGGLFIGALVVLLLFALQSFGSALGGVIGGGTPGQAGQQELLKTVILGAFVVLMIGGVVWQARRMAWPMAARVLVLSLILVLFAYEVRSAFMSSFRNGATPVELLVYTQSSPDVPEVAQRVTRLGRDLTAFSDRNNSDVTGGLGMDIGLDMSVEWPFDWYWRDQHKIARFQKGAYNFAANSPILIASQESKDDPAFQQQVQGKYHEEHYKLRWWFPEDTYKNADFVSSYFGNLINLGNWSVNSPPGKYLLYREPPQPLGSTDFYMYVRNDLVGQVGSPVGSGSTTTPGTAGSTNNASGTTYKLFDMAPTGTGNGQFNQPRGIAIAPDGSYYVVDTTNMRVQKFDKDGKFVKAFGSEGNGDGQFNGLIINGSRIPGTGPGGITVDPAGNVYVADTWNHQIQKFDKDGTFLTRWGSFIDLNPPPPTPPIPAATPLPADANTRFYGPRDVAIGSDGSVYVTDTGNKRVLVFDPNGKPLRQIAQGAGPLMGASNGPDQLFEPMGIVLDSQDNVYIADTFNQRINVFDKTGKALRRWTIDGWSRDAPFLEPMLGIDSSNNIYATDPAKQTVLKFSSDGKPLGSKNAVGQVTLVRPTGIAVSKDGTVVVVDTDKNGVLNLGKIP